MPLIYNNGEGDAVAINSNYAVQGGLQPDKQSIALQKPEKNSPYFNIVAVRNGDQNRKDIKELVKVYNLNQLKNGLKNITKVLCYQLRTINKKASQTLFFIDFFNI